MCVSDEQTATATGRTIASSGPATGFSYNGSGCEAYPITKAGIKLITNDMAAKHGKDGIRFNCVAPNAIKVPKMVEAGVFEKYGE